MNSKCKFMWIASFLLSIIFCGNVYAAIADTSAVSSDGNPSGPASDGLLIAEQNDSQVDKDALTALSAEDIYTYDGKWVGDGEDWQYTLPDGSLLKKSWLKSGDYWYYLGKTGYMQRGLRKIGSKYYYFAESGAMLTGWIYDEDTDRWYHAGEDGDLTVGWYQVGDAWYWFDSKCVMYHGGSRMVAGHKYYFFDNGQMAANQYVELDYYNADGIHDGTYDIRLMGKRRPSESEKEQITKELSGVPREWIRQFIDAGWELMYYTDKAYFSAPKTDKGIYFVNYNTDTHYKKIKFSKPKGLAMAFGEFAASKLSDAEITQSIADFEQYLTVSGLVQPLPSYFDDKTEKQFGNFFAACCDEDVRADIRKESPELYEYVRGLGFWHEGEKPDEAELIEMNSDPEISGNGTGPASDESLNAKYGPAS